MLDADDKKKIIAQPKDILRDGCTNLKVYVNDDPDHDFLMRYLLNVRKYFKEIFLVGPGLVFSDRKVADFVVDQRINISFPLYGSRPEIHDLITGRAGSFSRLMDDASYIKSRGTSHISLYTMILKQNLDDIPEIFSLCNDELGLNMNSVSLPDLLENHRNHWNDFFVDFIKVRDCILSIKFSKRTITSIPPCIFSDDDLHKLENIWFDTTVSAVRVSELKDDSHPESVFWRKSRQCGCDRCHLHFAGICDGIPEEYFRLNEGFRFNPVSEKTFIDRPMLFRKD